MIISYSDNYLNTNIFINELDIYLNHANSGIKFEIFYCIKYTKSYLEMIWPTTGFKRTQDQFLSMPQCIKREC